MRKVLFSLIVNMGAAVWAGHPVVMGPLPASEYVDTEVTTNCPFSLADPDARHLGLKIDLVATSSNNVEVAFGHDANDDGVLALEEITLAVGWDAGRWLLREGLATGNPERLQLAANAVTDAPVKRLRFSLDWNETQAKSIVAVENEQELDWSPPEPLPTWLYDSSWNTMRLAVRGPDLPGETVWAKVIVEGTTLMVR